MDTEPASAGGRLSRGSVRRSLWLERLACQARARQSTSVAMKSANAVPGGVKTAL